MTGTRSESRTPSDFEDLSVTVMGLGLFGGGAAVSRWLAARGARVTVTDLRTSDELAPALRALSGFDLRFVLGEHRDEDFTRAAAVVANPAVSPRNPYLDAARAAGVPVTSEMELFLERCPARIGAVTGTQGKSSTCYTLAQLLEASGFRVHLGGNIGRSLLDDLDSMAPTDIAVVEMSSYQLEALPSPQERLLQDRHGGPGRVEIVAVTNVLADHLERHGSVEAYAAAKRRILPLAARGAAGGAAVLSAEDERISRWTEPGLERLDVYPTRASDTGLNFREGRFRLAEEVLGHLEDLAIRGKFQRENVLVALGMARHLGADADRLAAAISGIRSLPHRFEDLGLRCGHRVWDNGVSTTPDSTISVLRSVAPGCTLLCGGRAKNLPIDELAAAASGHVRRAIVFGASADHFGSAFRSAGVEALAAPTVESAVEMAFDKMEEAEELLFSPAAASFDAYLNFRERAQAFRRALPPEDAPSR